MKRRDFLQKGCTFAALALPVASEASYTPQFKDSDYVLGHEPVDMIEIMIKKVGYYVPYDSLRDLGQEDCNRLFKLITNQDAEVKIKNARIYYMYTMNKPKCSTVYFLDEERRGICLVFPQSIDYENKKVL